MFTSSTLKKFILGNLLFVCLSVSSQSNGIFHGGISDGFAMSCAGTTSVIAMPVTLVSFGGECRDKQVQLAWRTASEINSSHFILERSFCGIRWEFISKINSAGNATHLSRYSFNDKLDGTNRRAYYRLKQVDNDGNFDYSKIITIDACQLASNNFSVYPNPSQGEIHFATKMSRDEIQSLEIYNIMGEVLYRSNHFEPTINLNQFPAGVYFVRIRFINQTITEKFILESSR